MGTSTAIFMSACLILYLQLTLCQQIFWVLQSGRRSLKVGICPKWDPSLSQSRGWWMHSSGSVAMTGEENLCPSFLLVCPSAAVSSKAVFRASTIHFLFIWYEVVKTSPAIIQTGSPTPSCTAVLVQSRLAYLVWCYPLLDLCVASNGSSREEVKSWSNQKVLHLETSVPQTSLPSHDSQSKEVNTSSVVTKIEAGFGPSLWKASRCWGR